MIYLSAKSEVMSYKPYYVYAVLWTYKKSQILHEVDEIFSKMNSSSSEMQNPISKN